MKTPFLFLASALSAGIILADLFSFSLTYYVLFSAALLLFILLYQYYSRQLFKPVIQTSALMLLCITTGVSIRSIQIQQRFNKALLLQKASCIKVILTEYKGAKGKSELWRGKIDDDAAFYQASHYIHLFLDTAGKYQENMILLVPVAVNSWEFCTDKKNAWMLKSNVIAQAFPRHFIVSKQRYTPNRVMQGSEDLQQYTITILRTHIKDQDAGAIAISMILGQRTEISSDLQNAYKNTGTIHILAVSGMHVALLHQALIFLTAFSGNHKKIKVVKNIVSFFILWFYALLTGFSASVVRAAAMFSLVLIASSLEKKDKGFNNLCAASFILLCYDPSWIYDFGFLLSVSAVAGIYLFTIKPSPTSSTLKKFILSSAGVSIAAQAGTLPISLYLSRNFPLYFLPANLILIPISSLGLYLGLALLITHYIPVLNTINGWLLEYTLIVMNKAAVFIAQLPGGLIHLYHFNTTRACCLGIILISWAIYLQYKNKLSIFITLILIIGFMFNLITEEVKTAPVSSTAVKKYYQEQALVCILKGRTLYIKYKGTEPPAYNWLNRKLNLEDGVVTRVIYLPYASP